MLEAGDVDDLDPTPDMQPHRGVQRLPEAEFAGVEMVAIRITHLEGEVVEEVVGHAKTVLYQNFYTRNDPSSNPSYSCLQCTLENYLKMKRRKIC